MRDTDTPKVPAGTTSLASIPHQRLTYTLQNAATAVDLSIATLRRLEKAGRLRFIRIGGRTLVRADSLHALTSE
jgi:excisionase family DNA binding protein